MAEIVEFPARGFVALDVDVDKAIGTNAKFCRENLPWMRAAFLFCNRSRAGAVRVIQRLRDDPEALAEMMDGWSETAKYLGAIIAVLECAEARAILVVDELGIEPPQKGTRR